MNVLKCSNAVLAIKGSDTYITCDGISRTSIRETMAALPQAAAAAAAATILVPVGLQAEQKRANTPLLLLAKSAMSHCMRARNAKLLKRHPTRRHGVKFHKT